MVLLLPPTHGDDSDDMQLPAEAAESTDGKEKKEKRMRRILLELFVPDAATAQAWVQRAVLEQELFFGKASAQKGIPLARLGSYPAQDIAKSVATDFKTAGGSPLLAVRYHLLCSA